MGGIYWLASYPKSGNTWFRSFLHNLQQDGDAPADINQMTATIASARPWLDEVLGFDTADLHPDEIDSLRPAVYRWSLQEKETSYHKIHDAYISLANGEPLVSREGTLGCLYIIRNPLDVVVSLASHNHASFDETIKAMGEPGKAWSHSLTALPPQVRQQLLSWSGHVLSWADAPRLKRLVIRYEDMLAEPLQTFAKAAEFLQMPSEPARIEKAIRFSDFKVLSAQEAEKGFIEKSVKAKRFFRQGQSGAWREQLDGKQVQRIVADHGAVMRRFGYLDEELNLV